MIGVILCLIFANVHPVVAPQHELLRARTQTNLRSAM
jgi:hypothetical protein